MHFCDLLKATQTLSAELGKHLFQKVNVLNVNEKVTMKRRFSLNVDVLFLKFRTIPAELEEKVRKFKRSLQGLHFPVINRDGASATPLPWL